jgi:type II secretory ATPase GspE/PulE/Tfp pilus assembly ATPase PilB-like protein
VRLVLGERPSLTLAQLGHQSSVCAAMQQALLEPRGVIVVAGPRRSGRSTMAIAVRNELAADEARMVASVVDLHVAPAANVATTQLRGDSEEQVATAVQAMLQHDVDALHVDAPLGALAMSQLIRAAHRGCVVIATCDGNDFQETLQGLLDHGVSGESIASNLTAVVVQHLVRRNCPHCRVPSDAALPPLAGACETLSFAGAGCEHCDHTGFDGRVPVVEFLPNSAALRSALRHGVAPHDLAAMARQNGLCSLRDSAIEWLRAGEVSLAELGNVLAFESREEAPAPGGASVCS